MTTKITEHTITTKRKKHPNAAKYPFRATQETFQASLKFLANLSAEERNLIKENDLIVDEEETTELYDLFKVKDHIGLVILRENGGFCANQYVIEEITDQDYLICKNIKTEKNEEISFQDVSVGLALGFAEILYRDEKPFGVSEDMEIKISISQNIEKEKEKEEEISTTSVKNENTM